MDNRSQSLFDRLMAFPLSENGEVGGFESRLADENGWTLGFAIRVTAEYLRFIVLTQVSGQMVCPSEEVDRAWHLHLTRTTSYRAMCDSVLGNFLHHHASKGGLQELDKHRGMYKQTLAAYREVFAETPPTDIWPPVDVRFQFKPRGTSLEHSNPHTVDTHTAFSAFRILLFISVLGAIALTPNLSKTIWPAVDGPRFLFIYGVALITACLLPYLASLGVMVKANDLRLDSYEVAYLVAGSGRVMATAVTRLVTVKALVLLSSSKRGKIDSIICEKPQYIPEEVIAKLHPIEREVLWALPVGHTQTDEIHALCSHIFEPIYHRLVRMGLVIRANEMLAFRAVAIALLLVLSSVGLSRLIYGLQYGHAVLFLEIGLLLTLWVSFSFWKKRGSVTPLGAEVIRKLGKRHAQLKIDNGKHQSDVAKDGAKVTPLLTLSLALFGTQAAMASTEFARVNHILGSNSSKMAGNSQSSTGCSGSSCGGGGGCGGGGCGG